jgi:hypothetical protein
MRTEPVCQFFYVRALKKLPFALLITIDSKKDYTDFFYFQRVILCFFLTTLLKIHHLLPTLKPYLS